MRLIKLLVLVVCISGALPAYASVPEARAVARSYGCNPKKIEVIKTNLGTPSQTIYRISCNMPKVSGGDSGKSANALIVRCYGTMCNMLRATK